MSATSVLRAVVLGVLLFAASGCQALHIGCARANVEAEAAVHDREADQVVFTVGLTDRRGNPIPDAKVAVTPLYGSGEGSGIPLTSPSTDATGVAIGSVPVEELKREALGRGSLNGQWHASFFVNDTVNGVFYCKESGFGEMPDDVVREVNDARAQFRSN